ncbi:hypothetical protein LTR04_007382 [Oleoguttula sp. CCFEE 6159]|nr:hypothetical protein LTR04_007382 [Oleoguttula sp. CCFEE 6159]
MKASSMSPGRGIMKASRKTFASCSIIPFQTRLGLARFSASSTWRARSEKASSKSRPGKPQEKLIERDFFLSVLSASATKRDAKTYLSRFKPPTTPQPTVLPDVEKAVSKIAGKDNYDAWRLNKTGVNLGSLYTPAKAIEESPVFAQQPVPQHLVSESGDPLHVALVKIRAPQSLDHDTLSGIGITLSQLVRLGLNSVVVVDCDDEDMSNGPDRTVQSWREIAAVQAERVAAAIEKHNNAGARCVDTAIGISPCHHEVQPTVHVRGGVKVQFPTLLLKPLSKGAIPVIPSIAYTTETQKIVRVKPDDIMLALTREFAGITARTVQGTEPGKMVQSIVDAVKSQRVQTSLDRVIVLDPLGGIPAADRSDGAHVFINLEQEYEDIKKQLWIEGLKESDRKIHWALDRHSKNLELMQRALTLLPPTSSAFLTTPEEAAVSAKATAIKRVDLPGVSTRRQRNPLIHNLLTDKPVVSSSLPTARLNAGTGTTPRTTPSTFVKRGMPVSIIPNPRRTPWVHPRPGQKQITLKDPDIDFPCLLHLIEDSFNRPLNVEHYLARIENRIAGIIVAGEYEGGAILTWEMPPTIPISSQGTQEARTRMVPYLDKFAVLKRSQGAGGVADIVFKAMVRTCFPDGVCWRSRKDNPVNKWYFERAVGTWKLPGTNWTMFWTTENAVRDGQMFNDYFAVCRDVQPSWANNKAVVD